MGATLRLLRPFDGLMDLSCLSALTDAPPAAFPAVRVPVGRTAAALSELFAIEPDGGDTLVRSGDLRRAIRVGAGLSRGAIRVIGSVGAEAGAGMTGGTLHISGSAGDHALSHMENGFAVIAGDAGDGLARAMRRGMLVVSGRCGENACAELRGGTALLLSGAGRGLCAGMDRGMVLLPPGADVPAGFSRAARMDLPFLRLTLTLLRERGVPLPDAWYGAAFTRYRGDAAALGKGEIFIPAEVDT